MDNLPNAVSNTPFVLVDDSALIRHVLEALLTGLGATRIEVAYDGEKALHILERVGREGGDRRTRPCVISDMQLPGISGLGLLRTIRIGAAHVPSDTPVVLLTAHQEQCLKQNAADLDVNAFLEKPVSRKTFGATIWQTLVGDIRLKSPDRYSSVIID